MKDLKEKTQHAVKNISTADNDLSLLDYTLSLSYEERLTNHQRALETLKELTRARATIYGESHSSSKKTS